MSDEVLVVVAAGIPKDHIVLGFQPADVRPYTAYSEDYAYILRSRRAFLRRLSRRDY